MVLEMTRPTWFIAFAILARICIANIASTRKARISLDEIDAAVDRISFEVVSPLRKPAFWEFTQKLLKKHGFEGRAEVTIEEIGEQTRGDPAVRQNDGRDAGNRGVEENSYLIKERH